jgi:hypothetical protein
MKVSEEHVIGMENRRCDVDSVSRLPLRCRDRTHGYRSVLQYIEPLHYKYNRADEQHTYE